VQRFVILTQKEIEQWNEDSMQFFLNQKEWGNDVKGNYLRERAENLISNISLRYDPFFRSFVE